MNGLAINKLMTGLWTHHFQGCQTVTVSWPLAFAGVWGYSLYFQRLQHQPHPFSWQREKQEKVDFQCKWRDSKREANGNNKEFLYILFLSVSLVTWLWYGINYRAFNHTSQLNVSQRTQSTIFGLDIIQSFFKRRQLWMNEWMNE